MKLLLLTTLFLCLPGSAVCAQDAAKQIASVVDEVEQQLKILKVSQDLVQQCTQDVADTRANLKQGNLYLSLYIIRNCKLELASLSYASSKGEVIKRGVDAFEEEWRHLGSVLSEKEKLLAATPRGSVAVALALAQVSQVQARPYYQSGRLYGLNSTLADGIYYLGRAPANLDFAIFAGNLNFPEAKSQLSYRSVEAELSKLDSETLRAYKTADVSTQQVLFNRLNSSLKVTSELNKASMFQGALLKYLESEMLLGQIITTIGDGDLKQLQNRAVSFERQLKSARHDQSIGLIFCQLAQTSLKPLSNEAPTEVQIKRAVVILDRVLPAYLEYMKE